MRNDTGRTAPKAVADAPKAEEGRCQPLATCDRCGGSGYLIGAYYHDRRYSRTWIDIPALAAGLSIGDGEPCAALSWRPCRSADDERVGSAAMALHSRPPHCRIRITSLDCVCTYHAGRIPAGARRMAHMLATPNSPEEHWAIMLERNNGLPPPPTPSQVAAIARSCAAAWDTAANVEQAAAGITFGEVKGAKRGPWQNGRLDISQYSAS